MKFSVLIPVYNTEKYLDECIQSVLNQTYQDFEIILVDDGSTDNSGKICDNYARNYSEIIKVIHQENKGQLASRCNAVKAATGDYCIFADADDLLVKTALEIIRSKITENGNPDLLVYSFVYENEDGTQRSASRAFNDGIVKNEDIYKMFFTGTALNNVWTKTVKTEIAKNLDFDFSPFFDLRCAEDRLYSMVLADKCKTFAYVYEQLYCYRLFNGSTTRNYTVENIEKFNTVRIYNTEKQFVEKWNLPLPEWQSRLDAQYANTALYVFDLYYKNTKGNVRNDVLHYDWTVFLNKETSDYIGINPYLNDTTKKLWKYIFNNEYGSLKLHFLKKTAIKDLKTLKNGKG